MAGNSNEPSSSEIGIHGDDMAGLCAIQAPADLERDLAGQRCAEHNITHSVRRLLDSVRAEGDAWLDLLKVIWGRRLFRPDSYP